MRAIDRLKIDFLNFPEYTGETQVLVDGSVNLPLVGKVDLANLTLEQASATLQDAYAYTSNDLVSPSAS